MRFSSCALVGVLAIAACATPRAAMPVELDPSNPQATEAPLPPPSTTLSPEDHPPAPLFTSTSDAGAPTPAHVHHHPAAQGADAGQAVVYTCPMHPEVVQAGPGRCQKCGMNLVLRKGEP